MGEADRKKSWKKKRMRFKMTLKWGLNFSKNYCIDLVYVNLLYFFSFSSTWFYLIIPFVVSFIFIIKLFPFSFHFFFLQTKNWFEKLQRKRYPNGSSSSRILSQEKVKKNASFIRWAEFWDIISLFLPKKRMTPKKVKKKVDAFSHKKNPKVPDTTRKKKKRKEQSVISCLLRPPTPFNFRISSRKSSMKHFDFQHKIS